MEEEERRSSAFRKRSICHSVSCDAMAARSLAINYVRRQRKRSKLGNNEAKLRLIVFSIGRNKILISQIQIFLFDRLF